jgi:spermidine synthase
LGESALHPRVQEITGVEIEPGVVEGAGWFVDENHDVLESPRLNIIIDDIGSFLRTTSATYQVISADEKTADEYASNGFSYSLDYYELLRQHLAPGGLVAQWVPTTLPPRQYQMILKTFTEGFPHVQLWYFLPAYKRGPFNTLLIGSNEPIAISFDHIKRRFANEREAWQSLVPYGLTSAEAVLPHFIADEKVIRAAVKDSPINSLEHPRYEFFYPWDYAREKATQFIANHELIIQLKRDAYPEFLASLRTDHDTTARLKQTFSAEFQYLDGFQQFLRGITLEEQYSLFDYALSLAPWNDSLRARIFAQYSYIASTRRNPEERAQLMQRANALYENQ